MPEQVTESQVIDHVGDQSSMVDDYFNDANFEYVSDSGEPLQPSNNGQQNHNAQQAKNNQQQQQQQQQKPAQTPNQPGNAPAQNGEQQQGNQQQRTGLEADFYGEDGSIKPESLDFFQFGQDLTFQPPQPEPPAADGKQTEAEQTWQQRMEARHKEEIAHRQSVAANYTGQISEIEQLIQQGYDPVQSIAHVKAKYERNLQEYYQQRDYEQKVKEREEIESEYRTRLEMQELTPKSSALQAEVAAKMGGIEKYNALMFNPETGGKVLQWLFFRQNPDAAKLPQAKQAEQINSWWTKFSSNKQDLEMAVVMAQSMLQRKLWPDIVKRIRSGAQNQIQQTARSSVRSPGPLQGRNASAQQAAAPDSSMDELNRYFEGSIPEI